ncbi:MAG: hypothetical protein IKK71_03125, partial [Clostridia bacterium]|nr:hypothetical protein [Clostridia bacterium]
MEFLNQVLNSDSDYLSLLKSVKNGRYPIACTGLSSVHKSAVISALCSDLGRKIAVITPDESSALEITNDLLSMKVDALNLPSRDYCIGDIKGYSKEYEHKRTDTLSKLLGGGFGVLTLSLDSALQYTMPPNVLNKACFTIKSGDSITINDLILHLLQSGYARQEICDGVGTFSHRGGIVDIYPTTSTTPYRLEFWGDEIDTISPYDTETQRRGDSVDFVEISPACEVLYNNNNLLEKLEEISKSKKLTDNQRKRLSHDISALESGVSINPDRYLPLIYPENNTVFEYLKDCLIILADSGNMKERFQNIETQTSADCENFLEEGFLSFATAKLWLSKAEFFKYCENALIFENFPRSSYEIKIKDIINFNYKRSTAWGGDINVLLDDINYAIKSGGSAVILAGEIRAAKTLTSALQEKGVNALYSLEPSAQKGLVSVTTGGLSSGFEIPSSHFILVTHRYIAGER